MNALSAAFRFTLTLMAAHGYSVSYAESIETRFPITDDTYVDSRVGDQSRNFGDNNAVRVLVNSDGSVTRGLFKLPAMLADYAPEEVRVARARFYVFQDNTRTRDIVLYPLTRPFVEGAGGSDSTASGATWETYDGTNSWTMPGGDYDLDFSVVAEKEPVLDMEEGNRFFSWDMAGLLKEPAARSNLLAHGAILVISGEDSPPASGSDRAPFTSSDDPGVAEAYRPHVEVVLQRRDTHAVLAFTPEGDLRVEVVEAMPHFTHRIERTFELTTTNSWEIIHTFKGAEGGAPYGVDPQYPNWTNAFYRVVLEP